MRPVIKKGNSNGRMIGLIWGAASIILAVVVACFCGDIEICTVRGAGGGKILRIDGNKNGMYVDFTHEKHAAIASHRAEGCSFCHHLETPSAKTAPCSQCHRKINGPSSMFNHQLHASVFKYGRYCDECHPGGDRSRERVRECKSCHRFYGQSSTAYLTVPSYVDSLHAQCARCHYRDGIISEKKIPMDCFFCHIK